LYDNYVFMTKTTEGGKTDVADVGRLDWDHVRSESIIRMTNFDLIERTFWTKSGSFGKTTAPTP
jgi:hypothetical protein